MQAKTKFSLGAKAALSTILPVAGFTLACLFTRYHREMGEMTAAPERTHAVVAAKTPEIQTASLLPLPNPNEEIEAAAQAAEVARARELSERRDRSFFAQRRFEIGRHALKVKWEAKKKARRIARAKAKKLSTPVVTAPPTVEKILSAFAVLAPRAGEAPAVLDQVVEAGLEEASFTGDLDSSWKVSTLQLDSSVVAKAEEVPPPAEEVYIPMVMSEYVQDEFTDTKATLSSLKSEKLDPMEAPELEPAETVITPETMAVSENKEEETQASAEAAPSGEGPTLVTTGPVLVDPATKKPVPLPGMRVAMADARIAPQPSVTTPQNTQATARTETVTPPAPSPSTRERFSEPNEQDIDGIFRVDHELERYLQGKVWHIELHMEPVDRTDQQAVDTRDLHFRYPATEEQESDEFFTIERKTIQGAYRLLARLYVGKRDLNPASIAYEEVITPKYRKRIRFNITKSKYLQTFKQENVPTPTGVLTVTVFEGASGDHRRPEPVKGARVQVVGFPDDPGYVANEHGSVRIPKMPNRSEVILAVSAEGFYETQQVVPIFSSGAYARVYLVPKSKVEDITKYFTRNEQKEDRGIIMGRVYDPKTLEPLKGEKVSLRRSKGRAVYIDSLPDTLLPATTSTGLFGLFNIAPTFRSLLRSSNVIPTFFNVRAGMAQYIEFGRGGKRALVGQFEDPISRAKVQGKVRFVGNPDNEFEAEENGEVEVPDVDLPPGLVVLESEAPGYRLQWHHIPWDLSQRDTKRPLVMLSEETLTQASLVSAGKTFELGKGQLFGAAEASLFDGKQGCVTIEIRSTNDKKIPADAGPYFWGPKVEGTNRSCLGPENRHYAFNNLESGEYVLRWLDANKQVFRRHVFYIGVDRVSTLLN